MLRGHVFDALSLQVVARLPGCHALQVTGRAGVNAQRQLQRIALEDFRMCRQQVLEDPALEGQKHGTKVLRVQLRQFVECRGNGPRAARRFGCGSGLAIGLRRRGTRTGVSPRTRRAARATRSTAATATAPGLARRTRCVCPASAGTQLTLGTALHGNRCTRVCCGTCSACGTCGSGRAGRCTRVVRCTGGGRRHCGRLRFGGGHRVVHGGAE